MINKIPNFIEKRTNIVLKGTELLDVLKEVSAAGAYVKLLFKKDGKGYLIESIYSGDFLIASGFIIDETGNKIELEKSKALQLLKNILKEDTVLVGDIYWMDDLAIKDILLEIGFPTEIEKEKPSETAPEKKETESKSIKRQYEEKIEIEIDVDNYPEASLKVIINDIIEELTIEGILLTKVVIKGQFKGFPLGQGGILKISTLNIDLTLLKEFPKLFDVNQFVIEFIKNRLSQKLGAIVVLGNINIKRI